MNRKSPILSFLIFAVPFVALIGCLPTGNSNTSPPESSPSIQNTEWKYWRTRSQSIHPVFADSPTLFFSDDSFFGDDGCNEYEGFYETGEAGLIAFSSFSLTLVACSKIEEDITTGKTKEIDLDEEAFINLLGQVEYYEVKNNLLWLYFDKESTDVMIFEPITPSD